MAFLIDATDIADASELRAATRDEHLAYLRANVSLLLAAGAKLTETGQAIGSAYLVETDDYGAADAFIQADPYARAGLFAQIAITRWRKGFFNFEVMPT